MKYHAVKGEVGGFEFVILNHLVENGAGQRFSPAKSYNRQSEKENEDSIVACVKSHNLTQNHHQVGTENSCSGMVTHRLNDFFIEKNSRNPEKYARNLMHG